MTTLGSDRNQRDGQLRGRGIQSDTFPTSTFDLATPVALPANLLSGDVALELPGKLTLHGVTKDVTITAQARLEADGTVVVAGIPADRLCRLRDRGPQRRRPHRRPGSRQHGVPGRLREGLSGGADAQPERQLTRPLRRAGRSSSSRRPQRRRRAGGGERHSGREDGPREAVGIPPSRTSGAFAVKRTDDDQPAQDPPRRPGRHARAGPRAAAPPPPARTRRGRR